MHSKLMSAVLFLALAGCTTERVIVREVQVSTPALSVAPTTPIPAPATSAEPAFVSGHIDWVQVGDTDNAVSFINTKSLQSRGGLSRGWFLYNWKRGSRWPGSSTVWWREFDCTRRVSRILSATDYSGLSRSGTPSSLMVYQEGRAWIPTPPDTIGETELQAMCGAGSGPRT